MKDTYPRRQVEIFGFNEDDHRKGSKHIGIAIFHSSPTHEHRISGHVFELRSDQIPAGYWRVSRRRMVLGGGVGRRKLFGPGNTIFLVQGRGEPGSVQPRRHRPRILATTATSAQNITMAPCPPGCASRTAAEPAHPALLFASCRGQQRPITADAGNARIDVAKLSLREHLEQRDLVTPGVLGLGLRNAACWDR